MKRLVIALLTLISFSCLTVDSNREPEWLSNYPFNEDYYIGIGSANTGDEAEDKVLAEKRAINSIASHIMTRVKSESEDYSMEDSTGESFNYTEEFIETSVAQNISGIETIDTYYSSESGYWVYMRLSKKLWEEIQKKGILELRERVTPLLSGSNLITRLQNLYRADIILKESPYKSATSDLVDSVETNIQSIKDSLNLEILLNTSEAIFGDSLSVNITVSSSLVESLKNTPIALINEKNETLYETLTDNNGKSVLNIETIDLNSGLNRLKAFIQIDENNSIDLKSTLTVEVKPVPVTMIIRWIPDEIELQGIKESAKSILSNTGSPFTIVDNSNLTLEFEISIQDFPPVEDLPMHMSHSSIVISLIRDNEILYAVKSKEIKDGGITLEQARQRSVDKLLKRVLGDETYLLEMKKVLFND